MPETTSSIRSVYVFGLLLLSFLSSTCEATSVSLAWDPSPDPTVVRYSVYYGEPNQNSFQRVDVDAVTAANLDDLSPGKVYNIFITAIDSNGLESGPSNLLVLTVPSIPVLPQVDNLPAAASVLAGRLLQMTAVATGDGISYQWRRNGVPIPGATASTYSVPQFTSDSAGSYDVVVSNAAGAVTSSSTDIRLRQPVSIVNGSFESAFYGWSVSGDQMVATGIASDAGHSAFFSSNLGGISQSVSTVAGQSYVLEFDFCSFSSQLNQRQLSLRVSGAGPLVSQTFADNSSGGTLAQWSSQTVQFVADSDSTVLSFENTSVLQDAQSVLFLLLDNVRLTEAD